MLAIRARRAFDGEAFRPDGVTVLLEGDRIAGVEAFGYDVPVGTEVSTYDGTLLPGLIDAHVHLVSDSSVGSLERAGSATDAELDAMITRMLEAHAAAGVTTVRDLGDVRYRTLVARNRRTPGEPRVVAAGPPLTVPGGHCHYLGGVVAGPDEIRRAVSDHVDHGVDVLKVMASGGMLTAGTDLFGVQFSAEDLRLVVHEGHAAGLRVVAHAHSEAGMRHAVGAGVDGVEHATGLTSQGLGVPSDLFELMARRDVTLDPTLGVDASRMPPYDRQPPQVRDLMDRYGLSPPELVTRRTPQLASARAHGVRFVSGLDAGAAPTKPHGNLWHAVAQLHEAGFLADEALRTATSAAADDLGLHDVTGRLRPGLAADLVVVDGDVATDFAALSRPVDVRVRGYRVTARDR